MELVDLIAQNSGTILTYISVVAATLFGVKISSDRLTKLLLKTDEAVDAVDEVLDTAIENLDKEGEQ